MAAIFPEPVIHGAPVAYGESHPVLQILNHLLRAITVHRGRVCALGHRDNKTTGRSPGQLNVKLLQGVDFKAFSRTVIVVAEHVDIVEPTITSSVAIAVEADA